MPPNEIQPFVHTWICVYGALSNVTANGIVTANVLSSSVLVDAAVEMIVPPVTGTYVPVDCEKV